MSLSTYLENQVLGADPLTLVRLLYEAAMKSLLEARGHFHDGAIPERSAAITKAMQIVVELQASLEFGRGGEIAQALALLYAYIQERLVEANGQKNPAALDEALRLLTILYEGWKEVSLAPSMPPPAEAAVAAGSPAGWTL